MSDVVLGFEGIVMSCNQSLTLTMDVLLRLILTPGPERPCGLPGDQAPCIPKVTMPDCWCFSQTQTHFGLRCLEGANALHTLVTALPKRSRVRHNSLANPGSSSCQMTSC